MMKASDFVSRLYYIATEKKTVYAWGMFGSPILKSIVNGKAKQYPSWYTENRLNDVFAPLYGENPPAWGFDCVGLVKGVLWGWHDNDNKTCGGASYASNGVPDISADSMINECLDISTSFRNIEIGEFLWTKGHCGIYIGNGLAIESTPRWNNGVQITAVNKMKKGYYTRYWIKHGKLPYIDYAASKATDEEMEVEDTVKIELAVLKKGSKGEQVKTLQRLLNVFGAVLAVDGSFGDKTCSALKNYQNKNKLEVDGICGINSWNSLLK